MRKQTKLVAVLSAAALLAIGASMTSFAAAGWDEQDGTWVYLNKDGDRVEGEWKKSGNEYFYLNDDGEMATETLIEFENEKYYVDTNGAKVTNKWISVDNEDDITIGENEDISTIWYYFGSTGKATRASGDDSEKVKELPYGDGKAKFIFDAEGHMLSGWQEVGSKNDLYYLGGENEGAAVTGWQQLEPEEGGSEAYDDYKWFYFDGGKAVKNRNKFIKGHYYTFNSDGVMADDWYTASTPPDAASGANAYASGSGALGLGWVYTTAKGDSDGDSHWYYLVNVRDAGDNTNVGRSIPFNYGTDDKAARSIKSKTYLFDEKGIMLDGLQIIDTALVGADGSKDLAVGTYYFSKAEGSANGQMVKGKATVDNEGENDYYYFDKITGIALVNQIKDGVLYGIDGKRVNAEDGNSNQVVPLEADTTYVKSGVVKTIAAGEEVIVSSTGKVRESGTVKIEDMEYKVVNYVVQ